VPHILVTDTVFARPLPNLQSVNLSCHVEPTEGHRVLTRSATDRVETAC
jgi:hypothetical protein